ncbi:RagB/SusD family nutrient uptake outer membrane protein [Arachidicoccus ginsenosidivorans]
MMQMQLKYIYQGLKRQFLPVILSVTLLGLASCNKWLDIQPKSDISASELFSSEAGFEEALNGVYIRLASTDLYGDELTTGLLDAMAQDYSFSTQLDPWSYLKTEKFDFKDAEFISRRDQIWSGLYNGIVNLNLILENLEDKQSLFTGNNFNLIKAEAIGLRGYLHFDLFRLFGSSIASGGAQGIPYVTTYSNKVTKTATPAEVMDAVEKDLMEAKALLKDIDPITEKGYVIDYPGSDSTTENANPALFMQLRRNRFNYYAVTATLARVYLYDQNKSAALTNALEVINSGKFPWTNQKDFLNSDPKQKDLLLYKELIFGWYAPWSVPQLRARFEQGTSSLFLSKSDADRLFETSGVGAEDLRYKKWLQVDINGNYELQKYTRNPDGDQQDPTSNLYPETLPAIRLSEMYYIAAECSYDQNPTEAMAYVDEVRAHRGIGAKLSTTGKPDFIQQLIKEARKEFLGEGQIFYMYKRLNQAIASHAGTQIAASPNVFVLPMPENEIEFGNR